ncbi:hypothetical protein [Lysinibacillus sp. LZ02]|uniref:hypothetical protein n=1 Tax=Lysinibacillus sp. LZ02 TaxID=3420668 RepID=UPI003D36B991
MSPGENIYFSLLGFGVLIVIMIIWLILRKRKKLVIVITIAFVMGYAGYYLYYPTLRVNTHAERYQQLEAYLEKTYPDKQLAISPKHYEPGYIVGEFQVNDSKIPSMGVTLRVDKDGQISQFATWSNTGYPPAQQELWREIAFYYGETYSLDKEIDEITKQDEWIDGELTVFALTINGAPSIAIFNYSHNSYSFLELKEGERGQFVSVELDGYLFIYIDEHYEGKDVTIHSKTGGSYTLNALEQKGQLIVKNKNNS